MFKINQNIEVDSKTLTPMERTVIEFAEKIGSIESSLKNIEKSISVLPEIQKSIVELQDANKNRKFECPVNEVRIREIFKQEHSKIPDVRRDKIYKWAVVIGIILSNLIAVMALIVHYK